MWRFTYGGISFPAGAGDFDILVCGVCGGRRGGGHFSRILSISPLHAPLPPILTVDDDPIGVELGHAVRRPRVERRLLGLRDLLHLAVQLRGRGLVEPARLLESGRPDRVEQPQRPEPCLKKKRERKRGTPFAHKTQPKVRQSARNIDKHDVDYAMRHWSTGGGEASEENRDKMMNFWKFDADGGQ